MVKVVFVTNAESATNESKSAFHAGWNAVDTERRRRRREIKQQDEIDRKERVESDDTCTIGNK